MIDPRIPYGKSCTWWGRMYQVKAKKVRLGDLPGDFRAELHERLGWGLTNDSTLKLPSCPYCGGLLAEAPDITAWYDQVNKYAREHDWPGYRAIVDFLARSRRCWPLEPAELDGKGGWELAKEAFLDERWANEPPPEKFGCEGYFGFGGGYYIGRYKAPESYCNRCPKAQSCWEKHRERVRRMLPVMCDAADELLREGLKGPEFAKTYQERYGTPLPDVLIMTGNLEDGISVALTGKPKERHELSLPYPFKEGAPPEAIP